MTDRELILRRIRQATADVPSGEAAVWSPDDDHDPSAAYNRSSGLSNADATELFVERCRDYAATVTRCEGTDEAIRKTIASILRRDGARRLAVPAGIEADWVPKKCRATPDSPQLPIQELRACDGVITGAAGAIAETGTIVLDGGEQQGRRALTLVPDLHICVVRAEQISASVPDAIAKLTPALREGSPVTFISGPSATSDIELNRVEGVHGPRRLEVVVAG